MTMPTPNRDMDAGPELDALIAEKVMGLESKIDSGYGEPSRVFKRHPELPGEWWGGAPEYSSDIAEAWTVVEHLVVQGAYVLIEGPANGIVHDGWHCQITPHRDLGKEVEAWAETAMLAICKAALDAVANHD